MVQAIAPRRKERSSTPRAAKRPTRRRNVPRGERREAILAAALDEFSARGYAAARLDDVATRAGVAKGTIYLYFPDKESLFQELIRAMLSPLVTSLVTAPMQDMPIRMVAEAVVGMFINQIYRTRRKDVIRLIIAEGPRFPSLAEFYHREVLARVVPAVRSLFERAVARGELSDDALARFPQLLVAPCLLAIIWNSMFERFAPLDVEELMRVHLDVLFGKRGST
jgi:AcrR family transcriptional regulator